ncbi:undecaprenyl-diphosphate phosphatase [Candidatus Omnitrophota bacterium]
MIKYIVLAALQGLTEFLPVSSSGHMAVVSQVFKVFKEPFFFIVVVHLGTVCSLLVFFIREIIHALNDRHELKKILIVTVISLVFGFLGRGLFMDLVSNITFVAVAFIVNGLILLLVNPKIKLAKRRELTYRDAVFLGLAQVVGMFAGISRSGMTLSVLLFRGLERRQAFKFSFLSAIPIIILAFTFEYSKQAVDVVGVERFYYLGGFLIAFAIGYLSLAFLVSIMRRSRLDVLGYYCILLGIMNLLLR